MSRFLELVIRASMLGIKKSPFHLTRHSMYRHLEENAPPFDEGLRVLAVSGSEGLIKLLKVPNPIVVTASYPEVSILNLPHPDASFDLVVTDQVLEHVEGDPYLAVSECARILKPGGVFVHTSCFLNPVHKYPGDFWRFTEDALCHMAQQYGEVISAGSWGNFRALKLIKQNLRFIPVPLSSWHPINKIATDTDPEWPIVTWVVGRKKECDSK